MERRTGRDLLHGVSVSGAPSHPRCVNIRLSHLSASLQLMILAPWTITLALVILWLM